MGKYGSFIGREEIVAKRGNSHSIDFCKATLFSKRLYLHNNAFKLSPIICKAMEANPEDPDLIDLGTDALKKFCVERDLQIAMELIAKSRMENQSYADQMASEAAIGIIGNLALIRENVDYIVSEGGIPILMSIAGSKMNDAVNDKAQAEILASAVRALGR